MVYVHNCGPCSCGPVAAQFTVVEERARNETGPRYLLQEHGPAPHLLPPGPTSQRILRIIIALQAGDQAKVCEPLGAIRDPDPGVALPLT